MEQAGAISTYVLEQGIGRATGHVHSVFRSSLNIMASGFLLHVGCTDDPLSCLGVSLPKREVTGLLEVACVGDLVVFRQDSFDVYSRAGVRRVDLGQLEHVSTKVPKVGEDWSREALERSLDPAGLVKGIGLEPDASLAAALRALSRVAGQGDAEGLDQAASYLIGRGLGLTPSGDDILSGFGTALHARMLASRFDGRGVAAQAEGRTTDVSIAYLRAMADGYANEDYVTLVRSLHVGDAWGCRQAMERVLSVGHTSGHDSLLGFVIGMGMMDCLRDVPLGIGRFAPLPRPPANCTSRRCP